MQVVGHLRQGKYIENVHESLNQFTIHDTETNHPNLILLAFLSDVESWGPADVINWVKWMNANLDLYDGGGLKRYLRGGDFPKSGRELCLLKR